MVAKENSCPSWGPLSSQCIVDTVWNISKEQAQTQGHAHFILETGSSCVAQTNAEFMSSCLSLLSKPSHPAQRQSMSIHHIRTTFFNPEGKTSSNPIYLSENSTNLHVKKIFFSLIHWMNTIKCLMGLITLYTPPKDTMRHEAKLSNTDKLLPVFLLHHNFESYPY